MADENQPQPPQNQQGPAPTGSQPMAQAPLSYGKQAVGLSFNPGNNLAVQMVKERYAELIDFLNNARAELPPEAKEQARLYSVAITEAQTAQMWAVKAVTWQL